MFDHTGLLPRYLLKRSLTEEERAKQLKPGIRSKNEPYARRSSVIRINSTFLEVVDKYYEGRGITAAVLLFGIVMYLVGLGFVTAALFDEGLRADNLLALGFLLLALFLLVGGGFFFYLLRRTDLFLYTHWPIRFNRKTRKVYVFDIDGRMFAAPWEQVFFCVGRGGRAGGVQDWNLHGHVLDKEGQTVLKTFAVAVSESAESAIEPYWEFIRRYMEEGPQAVMPYIKDCLPIAERREPFWHGFVYSLFAMLLTFVTVIAAAGLFYVMGSGADTAWNIIKWGALASLAPPFTRWLAMRTSKIPYWAPQIEAECAIEPNDPYRVDAWHAPRAQR